MKSLKIHFMVGVLLFLMVMEGCVKDTINVDDISDKANREYRLDLPGLTLRIDSLSHLVDEFDGADTIVKYDENGLLYLFYETEFDVNWPTVLEVKDASGTYSVDIVPEVPFNSLKSGANNNEYIIENSERIYLNDNEDVRVDSIYLENADIHMSFNVPPGAVESITIKIPQLYIGGQSFEDVVNPETTSYYSIDVTDGYMSFIDQLAPTGYIDLITEIKLREDYIPVNPTPVFISYNISDIVPDKIVGYFGQDHIYDNKTLDIEFETFETKNIGVDIEFKDFLIEIETENSYGLPFLFTADNLTFTGKTESSDEETKLVNLLDDSNVIYLEPAPNVDSPVTTIKSFNSENTDLVEQGILKLTEFTPYKLSSDITIMTNPDGDTGNRNFLSDASLIKSKLRMNVPLWIKTSNYHRSDTIEFDYNDEFESDDESLSDKLQKLKASFEFENGMPFDINLQVYFADENYTLVDSLFKTKEEQEVIKAAEIDLTTGKVTKSSFSTFDAEVTKENLDQWKSGDVKYIIIYTKAGTSGGDKFVQIAKDNYLKAVSWFTAIGKIEE